MGGGGAGGPFPSGFNTEESEKLALLSGSRYFRGTVTIGILRYWESIQSS